MNKKKEYILEIDEDGFPVSDGMRLDDSDFLKKVFSSMKRMIPDEPRAPIVSQVDEKEVFIHAFSDPLVAQKIELRNEESCDWFFLGGRTESVNLQKIFIDDWGRLRTFIGTELLPAVALQKAQSPFLFQLNEKKLLKENFFKSHRMHEDMEIDVNLKEAWDTRYVEETAWWDMGAVNPILTEHFNEKHFKEKNKSVLIPGGGIGHDAVYLEKHFQETTLVDFSIDAKKSFLEKYPQSTLNYECEDVFAYFQSHKNSFDAIFEHTCFCAIHPSRRKEYLEAVSTALSLHGLYFGTFLLSAGNSGPPFGVTQWELRESLKENFHFKEWFVSSASAEKRQHFELYFVLEKKI